MTPGGHEFLKYAKKAVNDYNNVILNLKKYNNDCSNSLNIGCIPVSAQYKITSAIASFSNLYPYIKVNIVEDKSSKLLNKLMQSELNFAIVRDYNLSEDIFNKNYLCNDEIVFVTSKDNPIAKNKSVSLLDIKDENFILLGIKSAIYNRCMTEFKKHNLSLNVVHTYNKIETILGLVSENLGSTLLMKRVLSSFNTSDIVILPIKDNLTINLSLLSNKNKYLSSSEILFRDFITNYLEK